MPSSTIRFSAAHLFYAVSLSAVSTALFKGWGPPVAALVILVWWQIFSGARRESRQWIEPSTAPESRRVANVKLELAVVLVISAISLGLLVPSRSDSDLMSQAAASMRMISTAVAAYEQRYGEYPPVVTYDHTGRPMHSWRALILEQLGEKKLAAAYRLDEPWDGPNNSQLAKYRPWHFRTYYDDRPSYHDTPSCLSETSIHGIVIGSQWLTVEQEQEIDNWLAPTEVTLTEWNHLSRLPDLEDGFWQDGVFVSRYRGRLMTTDKQTWRLQPGSRLESVDLSATTGANGEVIGEQRHLYHVGQAFRLGAFLMVALYPIRWLKRLRAQEEQASPDAAES